MSTVADSRRDEGKVPDLGELRDERRQDRRDDALRDALELRDLGDMAAAIARVRAALGEDMNDLGLVITLAKLLAEDGQIDKAERWFRKALELDPEDLDVRLGHATFLGQSDRLDECRLAFSALCKDLAAELAEPETSGDPDRVEEIGAALAIAGVNLANCALLAGSHEQAVRLASCWLAHPEHWESAHDIVATAVEESDIDPLALAERGLVEGELSPLMMHYLLELAVEAPPSVEQLARLQELVERGNALFDFDWQRAAKELVEVLGQADVAFRRAMMRGHIDEDTLAAWHVQRTR